MIKNEDNCKNNMLEKCYKLLDAYFQFRTNIPFNDDDSRKMIAEHRTTFEIIEELSEMIPLTADIVNNYMLDHYFSFTIAEDGSVKWAIWRIINKPTGIIGDYK